ncbi:hypothetical protein A676_04353 [Salmonella enterica subsp. enterica serovar Enteritidis str. 2010K-0262]|uniref:Uncharacterized protein n=3 Tax=Salmonella enterica I TaxID=59201 RepID=M7RM97_SALDU|nr:hypothetical protein A670_00059 [Salmonella enterica subsp. enterica serovar Dublin str. UC16]EPI64265.1 hypothetical protein A673_04426 [Salmonella enterica subsp. enterica serovar Enteritidis str. 2009K0958]EPI69087.1 hypothetical protein A671_02776 [Salmonella enterica subsp. enterica serovar Dublin str. DG22]EPI72795.1 hypothetical protein A672_02202 [Salmonella enterica subsp. enterica serovar Enteritidis str. 08-1080]EPI79588.1 hypothetical protein A676_04353 [Salmonella enterica subsp
MKNEKHPQMAESFQAANGIGLVVRRYQMQFAAGAFDQTRLARNGEFFFIGGANNADLFKLKAAHFAEIFRADPIQTA